MPCRWAPAGTKRIFKNLRYCWRMSLETVIPAVFIWQGLWNRPNTESLKKGGFPAQYHTTDICDGCAQGHDGINYSLAHRDMIANMIEIHGNSTGFDGGVFIASCDKSVPACLMGLARLDMPSIVVTGGVMDAGPDLLTLEQIGAYSAMCQRGEISEEKLTYYKHNACPSCGACSFMGTASTMQIMAEALGLMLPGSALMPATCEDLKEMAYKAGLQVMELARKGLKVSDIVTMKSFENAIMVHAAISGSTNSLLHIPAIAHELGLEIDADTFDRMHRGGSLPAGYQTCRKMAGTVLLLCRRCSRCDGGNKVHAAPGCDDCYRKDPGRKSGRA